MNILTHYSFGTGDRFGQEGEAQLKAIQKGQDELDVSITPVWNKSHREHQIIGTQPSEVRYEADQATSSLHWTNAYFVDADHINRHTVDHYLDCSDFFTLDVAEFIGEPCDPDAKNQFLQQNESLIGKLNITGIDETFTVTEAFLANWADQYLQAIDQAGKLFEYIHSQKEADNVVYEISIDEVETPQTPIELFFILKAAADRNIAINTIAPKFTGDFYKGIDYVGDIEQFAKEFEQDLLVIAHAVEQFGLPDNLKLSVHSGSDKFSLYPYINRLIKKHDAGLHLKTAGTTWLEELTGLAAAGGEGLELAVSIYEDAYKRLPELTEPYAEVINISEDALPSPEEAEQWASEEFVAALEHDEENPAYNPSFRQLLHCGYKIAAERGTTFTSALDKHKEFIAPRVTYNLLERHLRPLFISDETE
jgi:hypothetical protein